MTTTRTHQVGSLALTAALAGAVGFAAGSIAQPTPPPSDRSPPPVAAAPPGPVTPDAPAADPCDEPVQHAIIEAQDRVASLRRQLDTAYTRDGATHPIPTPDDPPADVDPALLDAVLSDAEAACLEAGAYLAHDCTEFPCIATLARIVDDMAPLETGCLPPGAIPLGGETIYHDRDQPYRSESVVFQPDGWPADAETAATWAVRKGHRLRGVSVQALDALRDDHGLAR